MACSTYVGIYRDYGPQVLVTDPFVDQVVVPVCVKECFLFSNRDRSTYKINSQCQYCKDLRVSPYYAVS